MIRAVIAGDSRLLRELLRGALEEDGTIQVVATAATPREAQALIRRTSPDVVTLDDETPGMASPAFLDTLGHLRPVAVVMIAGDNPAGVENARRLRGQGAVNFVVKPVGRAGWERFAAVVRRKVRNAAAARIRRAA